MAKPIFLDKSNVMESIGIRDHLKELKELYKLSMDQFVNLSINSKRVTYKKFYEERAIEKIELIGELEEEINSDRVEMTQIPLESKISYWNTFGNYNEIYPKSQNPIKHLVDEDALYSIYDILQNDVPKNTKQVLNKHLYLIESTLVAYGYLIRHIRG